MPSPASPKPRRKRLAPTALAILTGLALTPLAPARAQDKPVRVAILKNANILVLSHAIESGMMAKQGLKPEVITLNNGAAIVSAVVSNTADIGFAATVAAINARANNQPIQIFAPLTVETPGHYVTWFDAAGRLGPVTMQDFKGKTVVMNATGTSCEMQLRAFLKIAGVPYDSVNIIVQPFPQMPATLQLGNADIACTVDPFHTVAVQSPQIKATTLIEGTYPDLAKLKSEVIDGFFARQDWLKANADTALRFGRAMAEASRAIMANPAIFEKLLETDMKLPPAVAAAVKPSFDTTSGPIREADIGATIDLMVSSGFLKQSLPASDVIFPIDR